MSNSDSQRLQRPSVVRTPSNTYAPPRRPHQYSANSTANRHRNNSATRNRRNPNAEYRAQEKAYVQRIRQDAPDSNDFFNTEPRTPSLGYSTESETDDESPSTADYPDDQYDQETLLYYGNDDMQP
ncbi:Suppressor of Sensor Kinase (SLN1), partial [Cryomyces antarcticus]